MTRIRAFVFLLLCLTPTIAAAQPAAVGAAATVEILKKAAEALGAAGDAIGKVTDGVQKLIVAGDKAWSTIDARRTQRELIDLSRLITGLGAAQAVQTLPAIERYLASPDSMKWVETREVLRKTLGTADTILTRLKANNSQLVVQSAYVHLQNTLTERVSLLTELSRIEAPPTSKAELAELRRILGRYRVLVAQLQSARDELNAYAREQGS